jgi:nitrite reductase/ring-hydroxylating ferredoxin subunit
VIETAASISPRLTRLFDQMDTSLDQGHVPLSLYGDQEIYALEMERIFGRNWLFVAHESEIPSAGDYVLRAVGDGRWIVVRDDAGTVRALFDSCRHRGTQLCRSDKGNASHFRCPYHGWTYKNDGALVGIPNRQQAYKQIDTTRWSLLPAPRLETYRGLIFVCLDPNAPSLREHLGDFSWYLDTHFGAAGGMEVVGDPHRWIVRANWKSACENFSGDSYHTQTLHRSIVEIGLFDSFVNGSYDVHVTECSGHATSIRRIPPGADSFWGYPPEVHADFAAGDLSPAQLDLARGSVITVATIFPNLSLIHVAMKVDPDKPRAGYLSLRQWQPRSATEMEILSWVLLPKVVTPEYRDHAYRVAVATFSPSGNLEQDDAVVWGGIAHSASTAFARSNAPELNFEMGVSGMSEANVMTDWSGPGRVYDSRLEEGTQRTFLRHWLKEMRRP